MSQLLTLKNTTKNTILASEVEVARTLAQRGKGLLGRTGLPTGQCLWILECRSIHTFFMKFNIDVIFVNKKMAVTAVRKNIPKWRLAWGGFFADSCFEFNGLSINDSMVEKGDILYVGN